MMLPSIADTRMVVTLIAACGSIVEAVEYLVQRRDYADGEPMSYPLIRRLTPYYRSGRRSIFAGLWSYPSVLYLPAAEGVLAVFCLAAAVAARTSIAWSVAVGLAVLAIFAARSLMMFRNRIGGNAGDVMLNIVCLGLACSYLVTGTANRIGIYFIGAHFVLAYFAAGIAKVRTSYWRDGSVMVLFMRTHFVGNQTMYRFLRHRPLLCRGAAWSVMALECLGPFLLLIDYRTAYLLVAVATAMHVGIAILMGLNAFIFSFPAAAVAATSLTGAIHAGFARH